MINKKNKKIIITGGGTAGHIMPALAVIEKLKNKNYQILYIGSKKGIESKIIPEKGIEFKTIAVGKLRRYWSLKNFIDPFKFLWGIIQSFFIIIKFKPDVIFSKGGYVGLPVVIAGWILRKSIIIHESDITLGLTNRISLPLANRLAVSFPVTCYPHIPASKIIYTGSPLRKNIFKGSKERGKTFFQLKNELPTLLVTGGSQGARKINETVWEILTELLNKLQIIHITGPLDFRKFKSFKEELPAEIKINYKIYKFLEDELPDAIASSDLVVSRAGANMISEIAVYKKPIILIPLEGHQEKNASFFAHHKAACVINNRDLTSTNLLELINKIINNKEEAETLGKNLNLFISPESADIIVNEIIQLIKNIDKKF